MKARGRCVAAIPPSRRHERHVRRGGQGGGGTCAPNLEAEDPCAWFDRMLEHCYQYAAAQKAAGRPVVGILCEYTPRELIMAAGGVPICLCGGSAKTIPAAGRSARQSLPVDQVDLRLPPAAEQSVPGDGRPGGG